MKHYRVAMSGILACLSLAFLVVQSEAVPSRHGRAENPYRSRYEDSMHRMGQSDSPGTLSEFFTDQAEQKPLLLAASKTCSKRCSTTCSKTCTTTRGCSARCKVQTDGCGVPRGTGRTVAPVTPSHTLPKTTGPTTTTPSRGNPRNSGNATTGKEAKPYWVQAKIVGATDGDTVTVLVSGNKQYRVRLNGVDAPESDQPYGADAKKALSALVLGKIVKLKVYGQDRSRRYWADVYVGQIWVNHELVRKGCAWYYKRNFSSKDLDKAESDAKLESVGLWQDEHPIAPWDWRKGTRPEE